MDQPVGTGFSLADYGDMAETEKQVAKSFAIFLDKFFLSFPYLRRAEVYLSGESFAGTYIPYIANELLEIRPNISLKGLAIGNGWMDPKRQYPSLIDFAKDRGLLDKEYLVNFLLWRLFVNPTWLWTDFVDMQGKAMDQWRSCEQLLKTREDRIKQNECEVISNHVFDYSKKR